MNEPLNNDSDSSRQIISPPSDSFNQPQNACGNKPCNRPNNEQTCDHSPKPQQSENSTKRNCDSAPNSAPCECNPKTFCDCRPQCECFIRTVDCNSNKPPQSYECKTKFSCECNPKHLYECNFKLPCECSLKPLYERISKPPYECHFKPPCDCDHKSPPECNPKSPPDCSPRSPCECNSKPENSVKLPNDCASKSCECNEKQDQNCEVESLGCGSNQIDAECISHTTCAPSNSQGICEADKQTCESPNNDYPNETRNTIPSNYETQCASNILYESAQLACDVELTHATLPFITLNNAAASATSPLASFMPFTDTACDAISLHTPNARASQKQLITSPDCETALDKTRDSSLAICPQVTINESKMISKLEQKQQLENVDQNNAENNDIFKTNEAQNVCVKTVPTCSHLTHIICSKVSCSEQICACENSDSGENINKSKEICEVCTPQENACPTEQYAIISEDVVKWENVSNSEKKTDDVRLPDKTFTPEKTCISENIRSGTVYEICSPERECSPEIIRTPDRTRSHENILQRGLHQHHYNQRIPLPPPLPTSNHIPLPRTNLADCHPGHFTTSVNSDSPYTDSYSSSCPTISSLR